jgi:hypothetical protein
MGHLTHRAKRRHQRGKHLEDVAHDAVIRKLEDGSLRV